jgi:hypothetical protein
LLPLGSFKKITTTAQTFSYFFQGKNYVLTLPKIGWAILWAVFAKTHLVTLNPSAIVISVLI